MQVSEKKVDFNVSETLIDQNIEKNGGGKVAYHLQNKDESRQVTYKELSIMMNKVGFGLRKFGVKFENRVMILDNDTIEAVSSILGTIKIGATPFVANTMINSHDYEYLLNDSRAHTAIVGKKFFEKIEPIRNKLRYLKNLIVIGNPESDAISYHELMNNEKTELTAFKMPPDEAILWQYSSGTTGQPKGVMHTQQGILYSTDSYFKQVLKLSEDDVCYSISRLFFGFGQGNSLWGPLRAGGSAVLSNERFNPERTLEIIESNGVTLLFAAPTHYNKLLENEELLRRYNLASLRICISAGEPLPPVLYRKWKELTGIEILDGIGSTEAFHIFMSNRVNKVKPGSTGTPVPGYKVKIVDEKFCEVTTGEIGKLMVKGDSLASSYWNKYSKTKEAFIGEWLLTGDMYYKDQEDYYWYCGRSDDMIRSGGVWVSPIEVESTLLEHPAILEAAVVPGYTEEGLQRVKAIIILKAGFNPSENLVEEIKLHVKKRMQSFKKPQWIDFVSELPKTSTGKIQRYKFRKAEEQRLMKIRENQI